MDAVRRHGVGNRQLAVFASRRRAMIVLGICGTLLAACVASPNNSPSGAAFSDSDLAASPNQTGELHLVLMPPDALMGGIAEARS